MKLGSSLSLPSLESCGTSEDSLLLTNVPVVRRKDAGWVPRQDASISAQHVQCRPTPRTLSMHRMVWGARIRLRLKLHATGCQDVVGGSNASTASAQLQHWLSLQAVACIRELKGSSSLEQVPAGPEPRADTKAEFAPLLGDAQCKHGGTCRVKQMGPSSQRSFESRRCWPEARSGGTRGLERR